MSSEASTEHRYESISERQMRICLANRFLLLLPAIGRYQRLERELTFRAGKCVKRYFRARSSGDDVARFDDDRSCSRGH